MQDVDPLGQRLGIELIRAIAPGVRVGTFVPADAPPVMVTVTRTGGSYINPVTDQVHLAIGVYANTQGDSERLAGQLRHALVSAEWAGLRIRGHLLRGWVEMGGPARFPDPDIPDKIRFQFSGALLASTLTNM